MAAMSRQLQAHRPRKRFGQNFLRDDGVVQRIIGAIAPAAGQRLVEIGPGEGALTGALLASGCRLDVVELDRDLAPGLLASFGLDPLFTLHRGDALAFDFRALAGATGERLRVVGNLPYNISTPLIFHLLDQAEVIEDMHFMLQKEVVDRLAASPGNKQWGRLGIMAQFYCEVEALFEVPPTAFNPPPRVDSAIVRLTPRADLPAASDAQRLKRVVQAAFAQRRKTLRNNLKALIDSSRLETLGIDPGARAETLGMQDFIEIARTVDQES